jgi:hypothetical protein
MVSNNFPSQEAKVDLRVQTRKAKHQGVPLEVHAQVASQSKIAEIE